MLPGITLDHDYDFTLALVFICMHPCSDVCQSCSPDCLEGLTELTTVTHPAFAPEHLQHIIEHAFVLCRGGLLERCHSYKDKIAKGIAANHGLFAYPVLMAADILIYRRYRQSLADWEPSNPGKFALYLRKDLVGLMELPVDK